MGSAVFDTIFFISYNKKFLKSIMISFHNSVHLGHQIFVFPEFHILLPTMI